VKSSDLFIHSPSIVALNKYLANFIGKKEKKTHVLQGFLFLFCFVFIA